MSVRHLAHSRGHIPALMHRMAMFLAWILLLGGGQACVVAYDVGPSSPAIIPFPGVIGGTDVSNNAKNNPNGGYFSEFDNVGQFNYPAGHSNQLGNTAMVNDTTAYFDAETWQGGQPAGLSRTGVPAPDPGCGDVCWWPSPGDWVSYQLNVTTAGTYSVLYRFSTAWGPAAPVTFHMTIDGLSSGPVNMAPDNMDYWTTGSGGFERPIDGWWGHNYVPGTMPTGWNLTAGSHVLKVYIDNWPSVAPGPGASAPGDIWVHYFKVFATSATSAVPVITSPATASGIVGQPFSYTIGASNAPVSYAATPLPTWAAFNGATGVISGTPTTAGNMPTINLTATNATGPSAVVPLTLTIDPPTPTITSPLTVSATIGTAFAYDITASDNPTSFAALGLPAWASVDAVSGVISGMPTGSPTTIHVTVTATNSTGTGAAVTLILSVLAPPPVISSATSAAGSVGQPFTYQITASNAPSSYSATGLPSWAVIDTATGSISGVPSLTGTVSAVTISATNGTATGSATLTITINSVGSPPVVSSPLTASGVVGAGFNYQITATNSPTGFAATGLPAWASLNTMTGAITGTPDVAGAITVTLTASNSTGTSPGVPLIMVISLPPPIITSSTSASGYVGYPFVYRITASDSPSGFSASDLPSWAMVDSSTGTITGTPSAMAVSRVIITASNTAGSGSASLTIQIGSAAAGAILADQTHASCGAGSFAAVLLLIMTMAVRRIR